MSAMKIKKGDTVRVIAGKDKFKEGKVSSVDKKNNKVTVEGVNMRTNVMYVHKGQPTRVGYKFEDGKKVRVAKSTGEVID